jgi:hypothetical protein
MLLGDMAKGVKGSLYLKTKEGRAFSNDMDINVNINLNLGNKDLTSRTTSQPVTVSGEEKEIPSNTEGTVYNGYTIRQDDNGVFTIFSVGGAKITEANSLEDAMNIINGIDVGGDNT